VDFALGTDTAGSTRIPASNCGIWGFRPSHGFISVAGVNPLAPSFDTVGVLAHNADVLARTVRVLLAIPVSASQPVTIHVIQEAFELADPDVKQGLLESVRRVRNLFGERVRETSLRDLAADDKGFANWTDIFCVIQWAEINSCLGAWIARAKPEFGPGIAASFELTRQLDRRRVSDAWQQREQYFRRLNEVLEPNDLLCIPTTPALAPLKGNPPARTSRGSGYYPRTLSLTSLAGIGRLPQLSLPIANVGGIPVGLSLLARQGQDDFLLGVARTIEKQLCSRTSSSSVCGHLRTVR
jgi:amidase